MGNRIRNLLLFSSYRVWSPGALFYLKSVEGGSTKQYNYLANIMVL
jgi:hypothetical protein